MPPDVKEVIDDFTAAFSQISEADKKGETVGTITPAPVGEKPDEEIAAEAAATEAAAAEAATAAAEKVAADLEAARTPEQIEAELVAEGVAKAAAKATEDAARAAAGDDRLAATVARAVKQAEAETAAAAAEAARGARDAQTAANAPLLSPQELALVQAFEKDFPDIARAQAIVRQAEYKQV